MRRSPLACLVLTSLIAASTPATMRGQGVPRLDSTITTPITASGKFLVFWTAEDGAEGEQGIYLRNISPDRSITITSWEIYECFKVAGGICGKHDKGPTLKPGKSTRLALVRGFRGSTEGYSYKYRFTQEWTDQLPPKQ
ncbi:MAG: hypothetical protein U0133_17195 [Gemmatimonadales bacterium]